MPPTTIGRRPSASAASISACASAANWPAEKVSVIGTKESSRCSSRSRSSRAGGTGEDLEPPVHLKGVRRDRDGVLPTLAQPLGDLDRNARSCRPRWDRRSLSRGPSAPRSLVIPLVRGRVLIALAVVAALAGCQESGFDESRETQRPLKVQHALDPLTGTKVPGVAERPMTLSADTLGDALALGVQPVRAALPGGRLPDYLRSEAQGRGGGAAAHEARPRRHGGRRPGRDPRDEGGRRRPLRRASSGSRRR